MKITFLGTGTSMGVPVISCNCGVCTSSDARDNRLRSSVMIEVDGKTIVIDTGPDFRQQMLRENVKQLDAVLLTHGHKDHTGGLDDVRAFNFFLMKTIDVYARMDVQESIKKEFSYAFAENKYPGVPQIELFTIENEPFMIDDLFVIPIDAMHHHLPVFGFKIGDFTYITDANYISKEEKKKIKGSKVLVLNALRRKEHLSHFTLEQALEIMEEIKPERGYLTHISHQLGLHEEVEKELPPFVKLAYDGLVINV